MTCHSKKLWLINDIERLKKLLPEEDVDRILARCRKKPDEVLWGELNAQYVANRILKDAEKEKEEEWNPF